MSWSSMRISKSTATCLPDQKRYVLKQMVFTWISQWAVKPPSTGRQTCTVQPRLAQRSLLTRCIPLISSLRLPMPGIMPHEQGRLGYPVRGMDEAEEAGLEQLGSRIVLRSCASLCLQNPQHNVDFNPGLTLI